MKKKSLTHIEEMIIKATEMLKFVKREGQNKGTKYTFSTQISKTYPKQYDDNLLQEKAS